MCRSTVKAASLVNKSFDGRLKAVTLKPLTFRTYLALGLATISLPSLLFTPGQLLPQQLLLTVAIKSSRW
ncbi:hypothetical protein PT276_06560 [Orbaceae bacterium ESL0721]|nr:hypothetical protein [Orbaceae bacterium ESL0721]